MDHNHNTEETEGQNKKGPTGVQEANCFGQVNQTIYNTDNKYYSVTRVQQAAHKYTPTTLFYTRSCYNTWDYILLRPGMSC